MRYRFEDAQEYIPPQEGDAPPYWRKGMPWDCSAEPIRFAAANYRGDKFNPAWNAGTIYLVPREAVMRPAAPNKKAHYPFEDGVEYTPSEHGEAPPFWDNAMPWDHRPYDEATYERTRTGASWTKGKNYLVPREAVFGSGAASKPDSSDPFNPYPFSDAVEFQPSQEGVGPEYWGNNMPWDVRSAGTGKFKEEFCDYSTTEAQPSWHTDSIYLVPRQAVHGHDGGWCRAPAPALEPEPEPVKVDPVVALAEAFRALSPADRARLNAMLTGSF